MIPRVIAIIQRREELVECFAQTKDTRGLTFRHMERVSSLPRRFLREQVPQPVIDGSQETSLIPDEEFVSRESCILQCRQHRFFFIIYHFLCA